MDYNTWCLGQSISHGVAPSYEHIRESLLTGSSNFSHCRKVQVILNGHLISFSAAAILKCDTLVTARPWSVLEEMSGLWDCEMFMEAFLMAENISQITIAYPLKINYSYRVSVSASDLIKFGLSYFEAFPSGCQFSVALAHLLCADTNFTNILLEQSSLAEELIVPLNGSNSFSIINILAISGKLETAEKFIDTWPVKNAVDPFVIGNILSHSDLKNKLYRFIGFFIYLDIELYSHWACPETGDTILHKIAHRSDSHEGINQIIKKIVHKSPAAYLTLNKKGISASSLAYLNHCKPLLAFLKSIKGFVAEFNLKTIIECLKSGSDETLLQIMLHNHDFRNFEVSDFKFIEHNTNTKIVKASLISLSMVSYPQYFSTIISCIKKLDNSEIIFNNEIEVSTNGVHSFNHVLEYALFIRLDPKIIDLLIGTIVREIATTILIRWIESQIYFGETSYTLEVLLILETDLLRVIIKALGDNNSHGDSFLQTFVKRFPLKNSECLTICMVCEKEWFFVDSDYQTPFLSIKTRSIIEDVSNGLIEFVTRTVKPEILQLSMYFITICKEYPMVTISEGKVRFTVDQWLVLIDFLFLFAFDMNHIDDKGNSGLDYICNLSGRRNLGARSIISPLQIGRAHV